MVPPVVIGCCCQFVVAVIPLEESQRLFSRGADDNLSLFITAKYAPLLVHQFYMVLRATHTHRAWFGFTPRISTDGKGRFGLSVALHKADSSEALPSVKDTGVERFACHGAVAQTTDIVLFHILIYQETEYRRGCTERGDAVLLDGAQDIGRWETSLVVVYEYRGTHYPLSIEFAPCSLAPASIAQGEVQRILIQIMPTCSGDDMSQGIGEVMAHHLGLARSTRREVHEHGVGIVVLCDAYKGHRLTEPLMEIEPSIRHIWPYRNAVFQRMTVGACCLHIMYDVIVATSHNGSDASSIATILYIMCA